MRASVLGLCCVLLWACAGPTPPGDAAVIDAAVIDAAVIDAGDDPEPAFTDEERAALAQLRYDPSPPPLDPSNRADGDPAARAFGQRLFFDPSLSGPLLDGDNDGSEVTLGRDGEPGRVSCAGCHIPAAGFVDTRSRGQQVSLGARWTMRRAPRLHDVAFVPLYNWDGRRDSLWAQAIGVMESDRELNSSRLFVAHQIHRLHRAEYESIFGPMPPLDDAGRFPPLAPVQGGCRLLLRGELECRGRPGDGAEYDSMGPDEQRLVTEVAVNAAKALAAYQAQLRCGEGRFDAWLDGDEGALTRSEQRGAALFVGRAGCVRCHSGPRLTDDAFHNVGLHPERVAVVIHALGDRGAAEALPLLLEDPLNSAGPFSDGDRGVLDLELGPALEGAFRTPSLRCTAIQPSFMHTGQLRQLEEVVRFFNQGGHAGGSYPGQSELEPLGLSDREVRDLVAFLHTLTGPGPSEELLAPP